VLGKIKAEPDADGIIYDPASDKVLLVCGDAGVLIPISPGVDPQGGAADPEVDLGGKPEFLATDGAGRAFVNLTDKNLVAVLDTKTMKVIAKWPTAPGGAPVGLSIDPARGRLFIGCRKPQKLIVMSTQDGKILGDLPIGAGVDATGFAGDAFASCRDGTLTVARETAAGQFEVVQTVHTPIGARTLGLDPASRTLYLPTAQFGAAEANKRPAPADAGNGPAQERLRRGPFRRRRVRPVAGDLKPVRCGRARSDAAQARRLGRAWRPPAAQA
jgi:hypothetical protein